MLQCRVINSDCEKASRDRRKHNLISAGSLQPVKPVELWLQVERVRKRKSSSERRKRLIVSKNTYGALHFPSLIKGYLKVS